MERALIIGASGGIGAALVEVCRRRGAAVVGLSRSGDGLDVTDADSVSRVFGHLDGPFDRVVLATGILAPPGAGPEKSLAAIDAGAMAHVLAVNTIGTALVLQQIPRLLSRDARAVVGVLTARVGSIGDNRMGGWHSYRASKAAANQLVRGAAIEIGRRHKNAVVAALHPGTVATEFTAGYPSHAKVAATEAAQNLMSVMDGLAPSDNGGFFDRTGDVVPW